MTRFGLALILIVALGGCGQTGELFLPPEDTPESVAETTTPESTNETEQEDDEETPAG